MVRFYDWAQRLNAYVAQVAREPLVYGRHDCALFAANAVLEMTGIDFAAPYRGRYTTLRGGLRILTQDGYADHVALALTCLPENPVAMAMPGDLAVFRTPQGRALGVVQGPAVYVLHPGGTIGVLPLTDALQVLAV